MAWRKDDTDSCDNRVLRSGSWGNGAFYTRSAYRYMNVPDARNHYLGFRVMCSSP